ncbi:MAG: putative cardiolipin synthase YwiE [Myxococcota bacterium]|nr:putative cardiolipin synthase YwiE [Myxococcota bacterium]
MKPEEANPEQGKWTPHGIDQPRRPETWRGGRFGRLLDHLDQRLFPSPDVSYGNRAQLLIDGEQTYPSMLQAIQSAKHSILLETYIFASDRTGQLFAGALRDRAAAGVKVYLIYDSFGSLSISDELLATLSRDGVRILEYRPVAPWKNRWGWKGRNHRKILAVDRCIGFTGGLNISDQYAPASTGGEAWRDTHIRVEGPAADIMVRIFSETWRRETGKEIDPESLGPVPEKCGDTPVRVITNSKARLRHIMLRSYLRAIARAREHILISNAYFAPPRKVINHLIEAAKRGVHVDLVLSGKSDNNAVIYAGRRDYQRMLDAGVHIFEWQERVLHAKCALVDGVWTSIGSFNLDHQSILHNLEINVVVLDWDFGATVRKMFEEDMRRSIEIKPGQWKQRGWKDRLLEWMFSLIKNIL